MNSAVVTGGGGSLHPARKIPARETVTNTILMSVSVSYNVGSRVTNSRTDDHSSIGLQANIVAKFAIHASTIAVSVR